MDHRNGWSRVFSSHQLGHMLWHRSLHRRLDRKTKKLSHPIKPLKNRRRVVVDLKLRKTIDSYWARSKAFRVATTVAFLVLIAVPMFLFTWHTRVLLGYSFSVLVIIARLVFGYIARKEGYVEQFKQLSPKHYYYTRRLQCIVGGGLLTGFGIMTGWRVLLGHPLPQYSLLLFLALIVVGAYIGHKVGRKLRWY
jgi:hypothetical protein